MEYAKRSMNGDAGEYLTAFTITRLFGWPCRLYGVDIGVDGEIEILDSDNVSRGDIIKLQIKSCDAITGTNHSVYVDERHIGYWKHFCLPVIVCAVDLTTQKIYWKHITATEAYLSKGTARKITFDLQKDELIVASKKDFIQLAIPEASKQLGPLMAELKQKIEEIDRNMSHADVASVEKTIEYCSNLREIVDKIENIALHFPWRLSLVAIGWLAWAKRTIQITENDASRDAAVITNGM